MPRHPRVAALVLAAAVGSIVLAGCGSSSSSPPATSAPPGPVVEGAPVSVPEATFAVAAPPVVATPALPAGVATPARYDRVQVRRFGSPDAGHVLVLVPGTNGGAGDFDLVAPYLVTHVPGLQVWAEMRREGALQDDSVIQSTLAGKTTTQQAFDYYLGWIANPAIKDHYQPLDASAYRFVQQWGLAVAMNDLHAVVVKASDGGRRTVTLGGHSLGGAEAAIYAAWDFDGRAGYRGINGIVCIDGCAGTSGSLRNPPTLASTQAAIAAMNTRGPWLDLLGLGPQFAWATGVFSQVGAVTALKDPNAPATTFETFALLPSEFKPPEPVTNQAQLGYAFDASTSPAALALIHVHSGHVATTGDPAGWVNDGITPVQNIADVFAQAPLGAADWYYPRRLAIDAAAAGSLQQTPLAAYLGLRLLHTGQVDVPLYAFQTSLGGVGDAVARQAHAFQAESRIPSVTVVSRTSTYSHLDPLLASPAGNAFLATVVPWLKKIDS